MRLSCKTLFRVAPAIAACVLIVGCGGRYASVRDALNETHSATLTAEAFSRGEAELKSLVPGTKVTDTTIRWKFFKVGERTVATADGWIAAMSGGRYGALSGLGRFMARDEKHVYGEHVFGYLSDGIKLNPRQCLVVQGRVINKAEYESLPKNQTGTDLIRSANNVIYYTDLQVHSIQEVAVQPKLVREGQISGSTDLRPGLIARTNLTREFYEETERRLAEIEVGTDYYDVVNALEGSFITNNGGTSYSLLMGGFLNYEDVTPWVETTATTRFSVMPVGWIEDDVAQPKQAVIFQNRKYVKTIAHAEKDEIRKEFSDGM